MAKNNYVTVGKIGTAHGIKGWVKIHSYTETTEGITEYSPWYIAKTNQEPKVIEIESSQMHGKALLIKFKGIETPEDARLYTNMMIYIKRSQLPKLAKNEYYWSDLIGLTVINQHGVSLGVVDHLLETGSNDVLVVKDNEKTEHVIPYQLDTVITAIDLDKHEMHVNWEPI